jgi:ATP/maltotriose-dependent transcriptional regulator MalT
VSVAPFGANDSSTIREQCADGVGDRLRLCQTRIANKQIAYRLRISEKSVRNHVSNTYEKLRIYDRSQAVLYAVRKGLVEV